MYRSTQEDSQHPRPGESAAGPTRDDTCEGPTVVSPLGTPTIGLTGFTSRVVTRWLRREVRRDGASPRQQDVRAGRAGRHLLLRREVRRD
ncbi:hypothetical protein [Myxococcus sp. RHSTA-1-4]|uniref:hypothetical protein n=1 Tax=Myxococcus sp. RHSTA-1-4 TaxID=2874601 RepID=UPI001CBDE502|nr:hypothetical protein [Myxococcus sp. RHSTA-1-4]MBZ4415336.1 hypothetical protein [Myxococcus sp. RHSTA-1-4]